MNTMNTRNERSIDLVALLASVIFAAAIAVSAAWWYRITWHDIKTSGVFGFPVFVGMFVGFVGMPAYHVLRHIRASRRKAALEGK